MTHIILYCIFGGFLFIVCSSVKKYRKTKWRRADFLLLILFTVVSPHLIIATWFFAGSIYGRLDESLYSTTDTFLSEKWNNNRKYRYSVLRHVIDNIATEGKTDEELLLILGKPDRKDKDGIWHYNCKRPGWRFIDFSGGGLSLQFEGNVLTKSKDTTWID